MHTFGILIILISFNNSIGSSIHRISAFEKSFITFTYANYYPYKENSTTTIYTRAILQKSY